MEGNDILDDVFSKAFDEEVTPKEEPEIVPEVVPEEVPDPPEPAAEIVPEVVLPAVIAPAVAPLTVEDVSRVVKEALVVPAVPAAEIAEVEDPEVLEALADFKKEWPTQEIAVNAILGKALKAQETALITKFEGKLAAIEARISPLAETLQSSAAEKHITTITAAHPDAQTIMPEIEAWIAKQPDYLQAAYNNVLDNGSTAQVVKFLTDYKGATGKPAPAAPKVDEARLRRMETPTTVRTSVSEEADPQDFDSAFDMEAKKLKLAS